MPKGRKKKPTAIIELEGNPGKRPLNKKEPKPTSGIPSCPSWLSKMAKQEWNRVSKELGMLGLLTGVDRATFAAYCDAYSTWYEANEELKDRKSLFFKTNTGYWQQHPAVGVKHTAMKIMLSFAVEFGMTPSSRARIGVDLSKDDAGNPMAKLLHGKG